MMAQTSSSSSVAVFIDTSLDTRLAIVVFPSDTIADLKANVRNQHTLCFPDMGDVTVLSVKARRRGSFYHLCDSMLVRSAFNGIKGSWLLHMDVVSTCHQAETTRFNMTYPLLDKANASSPSKDASTMPGTGHVVSQDGKDVGVKDYSNVDKANDDMVSTMKKRSRKRISAASNDQLLDKDSVIAEKEKHQGNDDSLKEPSTDSVAIFGSCIYNKEIFISENACSESITALHGDPSQKDCNMDEKKKRRKKESTPKHQNDIHSDVPELGNADPLKEPSMEPVSKSGSSIHNKEVFVSENVRPESITLLHDDPSQKDCTMDEKKKKKRRKKESLINHQNDTHSDVQKSGNDNSSKEPSSDPVSKSGSCIHNKEAFISENVRSESITSLHDDPSQNDCTMNEKKKKKEKRRKKESSVNHQNEIHFDVPESGPIDTNAVLSIENQDAKKKPQEASMKDHDNLGEERDVPFISGKDTRNVIGRDLLESDLEDPLSLNHEGSNVDGTIFKVGLSMHEMGSEYTKHTDADLQGILVDKNACPRNADVVVTTRQEAALDEIVPTKKKKTRKRSNAASNDQLVDKSNSSPEKAKYNACDDLSEQPGADLVIKSCSSIQKKEVIVLEVLPESITPLHNDPSPKECTMDEKKKKRNRTSLKEASTNHQNDIHSITDSRPIDSHVLSIENHEAMENLQGASINDHKNLAEERDALLLSDKDARNVTGGGNLEFVSLDPLSLKHEGLNSNGTISEVLLSVHESSSWDAKQGHLTNADPKVTLVDDNADLRNSYDALTTLQEAALETYPEEGTRTLENSCCRKKKNTSGSSINKHDSFHSFGENVNEDNLAASGSNYEDPMKESDIMNTSAEVGDLIYHTEGNLEVPSFSDAKGLQCRSRKRSHKIELFNPQPPNTYEAILSSAHSVTEDSLKEETADQINDQHERSKDSIVGEATLLGIQVVDDSRVLLNPTDKTSQHTHSFMEATTKENPRDTMEDNCKEKVGRSKLRDTFEDKYKEKVEMSKSLTVIGEAAVGEISAMADSSFYTDHIGRNSLHRMKRSTSHDLIGSEPTEHNDSLVNEDKKMSPIVTLEDNFHEQGKEANSATFLVEAATNGSHCEVDLAIPSGNNGSSQNKQLTKVDSSYFSSNINLDTNLSGLIIVQSNKKDSVQYSAKAVAEKTTEGLLGNCHERAAESVGAKVHMEHPTSDLDKINNLEYFVPKAVGFEVHTLTQDHSSMETESRMSNEETSKRKRRTNTNSEDFTHNLANPSCLNKLKNKPQDDDPSKLDLVNPLVPLLNKESKTKRGYNKKAVGRASDSGALHEYLDIKVDQKPQISSSDTHHKASLSTDDKKKSYKDKTSCVSKTKPLFDDATSESSENKFEIRYRKSTSKSVFGNSSASEGSNVGLEETQEGTCLKAYSFMNSSGEPSAAYGENNGAPKANILIQKKVKRGSRPLRLSSILGNMCRYRKARPRASQSLRWRRSPRLT